VSGCSETPPWQKFKYDDEGEVGSDGMLMAVDGVGESGVEPTGGNIEYCPNSLRSSHLLPSGSVTKGSPSKPPLLPPFPHCCIYCLHRSSSSDFANWLMRKC